MKRSARRCYAERKRGLMSLEELWAGGTGRGPVPSSKGTFAGGLKMVDSINAG